jgi:hypothetical protein
LRIDHVGYCKRPNTLLRIGKTLIVIGRMRSRPQNILKVVITTQNKKSALPMKRHLHPHMPDCINKEASTSFVHTHSLVHQSTSLELQLEKKERERGALLGEEFMYLIELSLGIVLAIYIKEVFVGFSPP